MLNMQSRTTKKEKVQKLSSTGWGNFIALLKSWTNLKPIDYEYSNLGVFYKQVKYVENLKNRKILTNHWILISRRQNTYTKRHDKCND